MEDTRQDEPRRTGYGDLLDYELVAAAKLGDGDAFAELIRRSRSMCLKAARSVLRDPDDVEDQIQNALINAWQKLGSYRQDAKFSTWLTRIVINQCLMAVRAQKRRPSVPLETQSDDGEIVRTELAAGGPDPEQALGDEQVARLLRDEVSRSPAMFRSVLHLADYESRPIDEVAGRLGITVAATKARLHRARQHLRERMEKHLGRMGWRTTPR